jgi:lysozyme
MDILEQLKRDEGLRLTPYRDTVGKLTIGIGRNLEDVGISKDEAEYLLANDLSKAKIELAQALPWVTNLDDARRGVLLNMAFNMGVKGLLKFKNTLALVKAGSYETAAQEMVKSLWAKQVGERADRLAMQMRTGDWL